MENCYRNLVVSDGDEGRVGDYVVNGPFDTSKTTRRDVTRGREKDPLPGRTPSIDTRAHPVVWTGRGTR